MKINLEKLISANKSIKSLIPVIDKNKEYILLWFGKIPKEENNILMTAYPIIKKDLNVVEQELIGEFEGIKIFIWKNCFELLEQNTWFLENFTEEIKELDLIDWDQMMKDFEVEETIEQLKQYDSNEETYSIYLSKKFKRSYFFTTEEKYNRIFIWNYNGFKIYTEDQEQANQLKEKYAIKEQDDKLIDTGTKLEENPLKPEEIKRKEFYLWQE